MGDFAYGASALKRGKIRTLSGILLFLATGIYAQDATQIYRSAAPAVTSLEALDLNGNIMWSGTGFFVSADGKLITNYHVIEHAPRLRVRLRDHMEQSVTVLLAANKDRDLALLKVDGDQLPFLQLACTHRPEIGSTVFAIGNPLGILESTFSQGLISGVREVDGYTLLQTSAPISHGSSGGPLLNEQSEVVGITTATIGGGQNLNFAVPADEACKLVAEAGPPKPLSSLSDASSSTGQVAAVDDKPARQNSAINPGWLSSSPRAVLADPHFYDIELTQREAILSEIDPQFRKLPAGKRKAYLWAAETDNLPKPLRSTNIYRCAPGSQHCKFELSQTGITKVYELEGLEIKASFPLNSMVSGAFLQAHIRIMNKSADAVEVIPQTFSVLVMKPKQLILRFEYPDRVGSELFIRTIQGQASLNIQVPGELYKMIFAIPSNAIKRTTMKPGEFVEGEVYFEGPEKKPRDFVLNLFFGRDAYQMPFSAPN